MRSQSKERLSTLDRSSLLDDFYQSTMLYVVHLVLSRQYVLYLKASFIQSSAILIEHTLDSPVLPLFGYEDICH